MAFVIAVVPTVPVAVSVPAPVAVSEAGAICTTATPVLSVNTDDGEMTAVAASVANVTRLLATGAPAASNKIACAVVPVRPTDVVSAPLEFFSESLRDGVATGVVAPPLPDVEPVPGVTPTKGTPGLPPPPPQDTKLIATARAANELLRFIY